MGAVLSLPLLGGLGSLVSSALGGIVFFMSGTAASALFKSCNCNSSIATRVGFAILFCLNSMLAWLMRTDLAIRQIERLAWDWVKLDCAGGKCYGLLAVHRFCFALGLLHLVLALLLIGVHNTRDRRASLQNGWWGPKVLLWLAFVFLAFLVPNGFFMWYGSYIAPIGSSLFILLGLLLLIDFAHSFSESLLTRWEETESALWQFVLVGSTFGAFLVSLALTVVLYVLFAGGGCTTNTVLISVNLACTVLVTLASVAPAVQEANPKSGLAQASIVALYSTYLVGSAVANHSDPGGVCNPLTSGSSGTRTTTVVLGATFTFLAVAYSTTRAATQTRALGATGAGRRRRGKGGAIRLPGSDDDDAAEVGGVDGQGHHVGLVSQQPKQRKNEMRYQAILAAVEAGALPRSALDEEDEDSDTDELDGPVGEERDDERSQTKYSYVWFHVIFVMASMYVAGLLTDWRVLRATDPGDPADVYIGRSEGAMWMRVVSSWGCIGLYLWSLFAPVLLPDRFGDI